MKLWKRKRCPKCGQKLVPIIYGFPDPEAIKEAQEGKIVLGGCVIQPGPKFACNKCAKWSLGNGVT